MAEVKRIILWAWDKPSRTAEISINDNKENRIKVAVSEAALNVDMVLVELRNFAQKFVDDADAEKKEQDNIPDLSAFIGTELPLL